MTFIRPVAGDSGRSSRKDEAFADRRPDPPDQRTGHVSGYAHPSGQSAFRRRFRVDRDHQTRTTSGRIGGICHPAQLERTFRHENQRRSLPALHSRSGWPAQVRNLHLRHRSRWRHRTRRKAQSKIRRLFNEIPQLPMNETSIRRWAWGCWKPTGSTWWAWAVRRRWRRWWSRPTCCTSSSATDPTIDPPPRGRSGATAGTASSRIRMPTSVIRTLLSLDARLLFENFFELKMTKNFEWDFTGFKLN